MRQLSALAVRGNRAQMLCSYTKMPHLAGGMKRQTVRCEPGSGRDVRCQSCYLVVGRNGCVGQQCHDQILQRNDPNLQLHELGVGQRGRGVGWFVGVRVLLRAHRAGTPLVVPTCQRGLPQALAL